MAKKIEERLQLEICRYIKMAYPSVIFMSDVASGMRLTLGQAVKAKNMRSSRGMPDLFIAKPKGDYYCGLFIELKKEGTKIFLKDGKTLVADEHIREQHEMLERLTKVGYMAVFGIGFESTKKIIDNYLKQ